MIFTAYTPSASTRDSFVDDSKHFATCYRTVSTDTLAKTILAVVLPCGREFTVDTLPYIRDRKSSQEEREDAEDLAQRLQSILAHNWHKDQRVELWPLGEIKIDGSLVS